MRASAVVLLLAIAAPAAACPPMRTRLPVDPVVALQERLKAESAAEDLREVAKNAQWVGRQRSRPASQRARALAVAAEARFRLGETRTAEVTIRRAFAVDRDAARKIGTLPDALLAAAGVPIAELLSDPS